MVNVTVLTIDLNTEEFRPKAATAVLTEEGIEVGEDVRIPVPAFFDYFI